MALFETTKKSIGIRTVYRIFILLFSIILLPAAGRAGGAHGVNPAAMLAAHNGWRAQVGVPALRWSETLAAKAAAHASMLRQNGCAMVHTGPGENIFWASAERSATRKDADGNWLWQKTLQDIDEQQVVDAWAAERQWYTHASNSCRAPLGKTCGHYTQVVWEKTTAVGCAKAVCDDLSQVWVCHYEPAGNIIGQQPF